MKTGKDLLVSAARTTSINSPDVSSMGQKGCHVVVDITAVPGAQTLTFTVEGFDPTSGKWYALLVSAALSAVATTVLRVFPGATAAANLTANDELPGMFRVKVVASGAGSFTYSVGINML